MKRLLIVLMIATLALTGCSAPTDSAAEAVDVTGTVTVPSGAEKRYEGTECDGFRGISDAEVVGFDDISTGGQVVVKDESGTIIATGTLASGTLVRSSSWSEQSIRGLACEYSFTLSGLPDASFYGIHVGDSTRGDVQFSRDEMRAGPSISLD